MSDDIAREQALILFERAYRKQMNGELADAMIDYRRSIAMQPTAEAYTFLGWTYNMLNRPDEAIAACKQAIAVDPTFGNPYNDIGAYLIELGRFKEAIPWLEKALGAPRYEAPQYPRLNLGRVYEKMGRYRTALEWYGRALDIDPLYQPAIVAKHTLLGKMN